MQTLWFERALLPGGWASDVAVTIDGGRIGTVRPGTPPPADASRHAVGLPGLPNLHSHAFQRSMAGLAEARGSGTTDDFWTWRDLMYRLVDRLTPDDVAAIAAMAFVEMLESGFTRVGEFHYLHHAPSGAAYANPAEMAAAIVAAAADTGIALTLLPVFYAHAGFGGTAPTPAQRRFVTDINRFARLLEASRAAVRDLPDAVVGIAPHSLRAVTPDELRALLDMAPSGPVHIHIAEQEREIAECLAWSGQRPVAWLFDHAPVDRRWCLVHATHVDRGEISAMAASGAVVGLCPVTEANLGDGLFPADAWLAAGGAFGIGSDSNVWIDAAEELRLLEYGQRLLLRRRAVLASGGRSTGRTLFDAALHGGSRALGVEGGIAAGAPADLVALRATPLDTGDTALDRWIFAGDGPRIDIVWRGGRAVVSGGRHRDRDAVAARYRGVADRLLRPARISSIATDR